MNPEQRAEGIRENIREDAMRRRPTDYHPEARHHNNCTRWIGDGIQIVTDYRQRTFTLVDYRTGKHQDPNRTFNSLKEAQAAAGT